MLSLSTSAWGRPGSRPLGVKIYAPWQLFFLVDRLRAQAAPRSSSAPVSWPRSAVSPAPPLAWGEPPGGPAIRQPATTYGSARWADVADLKRAQLFANAGVVLGLYDGRYLRHDGPEHVLLVAPTRSGKGVGLVLPTLLSWTQSAVIHDIKGENWALTAGWRSRFSHCLLFDPTDPRSARFNPLLEVRKGPRKCAMCKTSPTSWSIPKAPATAAITGTRRRTRC